MESHINNRIGRPKWIPLVWHRDMKMGSRLIAATILLAAIILAKVAEAGPLATVRNSTLSVPTANLVATGLPGATNLVGSNFLLSAVQANTLQGSQASVKNSQQWLQSYGFSSPNQDSAPYAIAVRSDGGVVVSGPSSGTSGNTDFATVCYAGNGTPLWTNRFDGTGHGFDTSRFLAVDTNDNVWVTGDSMRYATNSTLTDVVTIKYASNGVPVWTNRYNSFETNGAYPTGLVADSAGNAYLGAWGSYWVGFSGTPVEDALVKYDANGNIAWSKHYFAASFNSFQGLYGFGPMALGGTGNLFVAGTSGGSVVGFGADGSAIITNNFSQQIIADLDLLTVDHEDNVIVTGSRWRSNSTLYVTMKFTPTGGPLWTNELPGPVYNGGNVPRTLVDPSGDIRLIGGAPGSLPGIYHILKISGAGVPLWTNQNANFGLTNSTVEDAAIDNAGNLYLTGFTPAANGKRDFVTLKFSSDGHLVWSNRFDGPLNRDDIAFGIAASSAGEVYIAGRSEGLNGKRDFATIKYADVLFYSPPKAFIGTDTITVTLTDSLSHSSTGTVNVVVAPGAFQLGSATKTPGGMLLQVDGAPGTKAIVLESSVDTAVWQPISTNAPSQGSVQFLDSAATNQIRRFYRVVQEQ